MPSTCWRGFWCSIPRAGFLWIKPWTTRTSSRSGREFACRGYRWADVVSVVCLWSKTPRYEADPSFGFLEAHDAPPIALSHTYSDFAEIVLVHGTPLHLISPTYWKSAPDLGNCHSPHILAELRSSYLCLTDMERHERHDMAWRDMT